MHPAFPCATFLTSVEPQFAEAADRHTSNTLIIPISQLEKWRLIRVKSFVQVTQLGKSIQTQITSVRLQSPHHASGDTAEASRTTQQLFRQEGTQHKPPYPRTALRSSILLFSARSSLHPTGGPIFQAYILSETWQRHKVSFVLPKIRKFKSSEYDV